MDLYRFHPFSTSRRKGTPSLEQQQSHPVSTPHNTLDGKSSDSCGTGSVAQPLQRDIDDNTISSGNLEQSIEPDAFFLHKALVPDPMDCEVEQWFLGTRLHDDSARRRLEAIVNEQRKIATSVDLTVDGQVGSSRVSPSLSSSQELLRRTTPVVHGKTQVHKGVKPTATIPSRHSPSNTSNNTMNNKVVGGFYIVKGKIATGLVAPIAAKGAAVCAEDGDTGSAVSDDNDSASTTGIVPTQFASINSDSGNFRTATYVRKQSDDMHSEGSEASAAGSNASDRTQAEPYLTSVHAVTQNIVKNKSIVGTNASLHGGFSSFSRVGSTEDEKIYARSGEIADAVVDESSDMLATTGISIANKLPKVLTKVDCLDTIVSNISQVTAVIKTRKDGGDHGGNYSDNFNESENEALPSPQRNDAHVYEEDVPQFVSLHDDFTLLSDEALLSLSELREKIDEVDRVRSRREMSRKIEQLQGGINPAVRDGRAAPIPLVTSAPVAAAVPVLQAKKSSVVVAKKGLGHHPRAAWEEPPVGRQNGSQVKNEKMFQSVLDDVNSDSTAMFSTSPGTRVLTNFGSRPNSRGAIAADNVNATIKQAITQIIRTNVQHGAPVSLTGVPPVPGVRGPGGSATRNTLRNTHISSQTGLLSLAVARASPLDISLAEARRMSSPLQVSPRTAFDDRSVSSTDSYRSHSSHYSSASGLSLNAREGDHQRPTVRQLPISSTMQQQPARKSALSIAMDEASAIPVIVSAVTEAKVELESELVVKSEETLLGEQTQSEAISTPKSDNLTSDTLIASSPLQDKQRLPSFPIAIITPTLSVPTVETPERKQSESAPANISVERLDVIRSSMDEEDEEELSGIFR